MVLINTAYANDSTPLHEYYHPFVRLLKVRNPRMFDLILSKATPLATGENMDSEELVTEYLARIPKDSSILQRFLDWIKLTLQKVLGISKDIATLATIGDVLSFVENDLNSALIYSEKTLTKADSDVASIIKSMKEGNIGYKFKKDTTGTDYINAVLQLAKDQGLVTDDNSIYYRDATGNNVALRLTSFVGDREQGEFSVKWKGKKYPNHEFVARQVFKLQGKDQLDKEASEITDTVLLEGKQVTFSELVDIFEKQFTKQRVYGKMVHAFIQYKLEQNPGKKAQAKAEATK